MNPSQLLALYLIDDVIGRADLTKGISSNIRRTLVNNNFELMSGKVDFTDFSNPMFKQAAKHLSKCTTLADVKEFMSVNASPMVCAEIRRTADLFVAQLNGCRDAIELIKDDTKNMMQHYEAVYKSKSSPENTDILSKNPILMEYWEGIDAVGPENRVIAEVNAPTDDEEPGLNYLARFVDRILLDIEDLSSNYKNYELPTTLKEAIMQAIESKPIDASVFEGLLLSLCKPKGMTYYLSSIQGISLTGLNMNILPVAKSTIATLGKFMSAFDKICMDEKLDTHIDNKLVHKNLAVMNKIVQAHAYLMCNFRYRYWNKLLILPNGKVNVDEFDKAVAKGITRDDLRAIRYVASNLNKDYHSMTIDDALKVKDHCNKLVEKNRESHQVKMIEDRRLLVNACMARAMMGHFQKNGKSSELSEDRAMAIANECAVLGKPPEYGFYKVAVMSHGNNILVNQLVEEIGTAADTVQTESDKELSSRDKDAATVIAVTKLLTSFVCKSL